MTRWITRCGCHILLSEQKPEGTIIYFVQYPCKKHKEYEEKDPIKLGNIIASERPGVDTNG